MSCCGTTEPEPLTYVPLQASELMGLEASVSGALASGDLSAVNILGFGEISVALGYPGHAPTHVCKRMPPFRGPEFERYRELVLRYVDEVRAAGVHVVQTQVLGVDVGDRQVGYIVQPLLPSKTLGHNILAASEPDPDHPFLTAVAEVVGLTTDQLSIDSQVTNWSWDGRQLTLIDVGTPLLWDDSDAMEMDMTPFLAMIPAPLRAVVRRDLTKVSQRWRRPDGVGADIVANLYREGLDQWVDPMVTALERVVGPGETPAAAHGRALYEEDLKTWPRLMKLKRIERAWRTKVRRQPYDFFIQSTFDGEQPS